MTHPDTLVNVQITLRGTDVYDPSPKLHPSFWGGVQCPFGRVHRVPGPSPTPTHSTVTPSQSLKTVEIRRVTHSNS